MALNPPRSGLSAIACATLGSDRYFYQEYGCGGCIDLAVMQDWYEAILTVMNLFRSSVLCGSAM
jgi:hypothetical protein